MTRVALLAILAACGHSTAQSADASSDAFAGMPQVVPARAGITADQVGVLVNDDDPCDPRPSAMSIAAALA